MSHASLVPRPIFLGGGGKSKAWYTLLAHGHPPDCRVIIHATSDFPLWAGQLTLQYCMIISSFHSESSWPQNLQKRLWMALLLLASHTVDFYTHRSNNRKEGTCLDQMRPKVYYKTENLLFSSW